MKSKHRVATADLLLAELAEALRGLASDLVRRAG
jgi:hypothetical protein